MSRAPQQIRPVCFGRLRRLLLLLLLLLPLSFLKCGIMPGTKKKEKTRKSPNVVWFEGFCKLPLRQRIEIVKRCKKGFFKDLKKLVKYIGRNKRRAQLKPAHKRFFNNNKNKTLFKRIDKARSAEKVRKLLLKKVRGGAFPFLPIIAAAIPSILGLVSDQVSKVI